ncbi:SpaH/EbpB family LPXTG-anchored major pilin [Enterococcus sp. DIV0756]|uniref:SpaH/EbpB family LPXTG-anchored major pilin n=1 Tax=Enterococcus sp. DIV0756 TaxID=2774636 RepID=UPI003F27A232
MKRNMFLLLSLVATIVFQGVFGFAGAAEASTPDTQKIVIHNLKYEELPNELQNTGDEMKDFTGEPLAGSVFTAYDVTTTYWNTYNSTSGNHEAKEAAGIAAAKKVDTSKMNGNAFPKTDSDGIAELSLPIKSGADNAIYLIKQTTFPAGIIPAKSEPFVIGLPSHDANGNLREEVHVYPKNEIPTNDLKFIKYGIDSDGKKDILKGAQFILRQKGGKYYNSTSNTFDILEANKENAAVFTSDAKGIVEAKGLVLSPGVYEFYEIESDVATSEKQDENQTGDYKYHFRINPKVSVTVSDEWEVEKYDYYDQKLQPKNLTAPFDEDEIAEAYNFKVPNVDKEVDDEEVRNGQEVTYTISKKIPEDVRNYSFYKLIDTFDQRLELCCSEEKILSSIKIDGGEPAGLSPQFEMTSGSNQFTITFTPANLAKHATKTLTFQATMKVKAGTDLKAINNDVVFENCFRDSKDFQRVETYAKRFVKVDSKTDKKLQGAEFVIKNKAGDFMNLTEESTGDFVQSVSGYAQNYVVNWVTDETDATKLVSDDAGNFGVYGLGSKEADYYTLIETKAPEGYVKLKDMTFTADGGSEGEILRVGNKTKGILPMTGGMGIAGLIVLGLIGLVSGITYFKQRHQLTKN